MVKVQQANPVMEFSTQLQKILDLIKTIERLLPEEEALTLIFANDLTLKCRATQLAAISQTAKAALEWNPQQKALEIPLPCSVDLLDPIRCALGGYLSDIMAALMKEPPMLLLFINILDYLCVDFSRETPKWKEITKGYFERRRRLGYHFIISTNIKTAIFERLEKGQYEEIATGYGLSKCKTPEEKASEVSHLIGFTPEELLPVITADGDPKDNLVKFMKDNFENFFFCGSVRLKGLGKPGVLKPGTVYSMKESLTPEPYSKVFLTCLLKMGVDPDKLAIEIVTRGLFDLSWEDLNDFADYPPIQDAIIAYLSMMRLCYHQGK